MKKILLSITVASLVLAGCTHTGQKPVPEVDTASQSDSGTEKMWAEVTSALTGGKAVECAMTNAEGLAMTYQIQDKKVRMSNIKTKESPEGTSMLMDGTHMYTWSEVKKEGVKMELPKEEDLKTFTEGQGYDVPDFTKAEDQKSMTDLGYTVNCKPTTLAANVFEVPGDVKFVDVSAMMKMITSQATPDPKEIDAMMKQLEAQGR
jgi:hypothetical protein